MRVFKLLALWAAAWGFWAVQTQADPVQSLLDAMGMDHVFQIIKQEGQTYSSTLETQFLEGQGGSVFVTQVAKIYAQARMNAHMHDAFSQISEENLKAIQGFYLSPLGEKIRQHENDALQIMQDERVKTQAITAFEELEKRPSKHLNDLKALETQTDYIAQNLSLALTANYYFFLGLRDGGAIDQSDAEILAQSTWQRDGIEADTKQWVFAFLYLWSQNLSSKERAAYTAFLSTQAGRALNRALFSGYGQIYQEVSYALGRIIALNMAESKI